MACPKCGNEHVAPHDGYYEPHANTPKMNTEPYVMDIGYLSLPWETQEAIEQAYAEKHKDDV